MKCGHGKLRDLRHACSSVPQLHYMPIPFSRSVSLQDNLLPRIRMRSITNNDESKQIGRGTMPEKTTLERARRDQQEGKAPSTQAGEFVREEIEHIRQGEHGARSTKQAIAIGLSKARRAGVKLRPPAKGKTSERTRKAAQRAYAAGQGSTTGRPSSTRSRAISGVLKREGRAAASSAALGRQARASARRRTAAQRSRAAMKAVRTKGPEGRRAAARKAVRTKGRQTHRRAA